MDHGRATWGKRGIAAAFLPRLLVPAPGGGLEPRLVVLSHDGEVARERTFGADLSFRWSAQALPRAVASET